MLNIGYHHKKMMWWKNTSHQSCKNLILMQTKCYSTVVHIPIVLSPEYHISPGAYTAAFKCDSLTQTLLSKLCSCWFIRSNSDVLSEPNVLIFFWKKMYMAKEKWKHELWDYELDVKAVYNKFSCWIKCTYYNDFFSKNRMEPGWTFEQLKKRASEGQQVSLDKVPNANYSTMCNFVFKKFMLFV